MFKVHTLVSMCVCSFDMEIGKYDMLCITRRRVTVVGCVCVSGLISRTVMN